MGISSPTLGVKIAMRLNQNSFSGRPAETSMGLAGSSCSIFAPLSSMRKGAHPRPGGVQVRMQGNNMRLFFSLRNPDSPVCLVLSQLSARVDTYSDRGNNQPRQSPACFLGLWESHTLSHQARIGDGPRWDMDRVAQVPDSRHRISAKPFS